MEANPSHITTPHLDNALHTPLLNQPLRVSNGHRPLKGILVILCSIVLLVSLVALTMNHGQNYLEKLENSNIEITSFSNISKPGFPRGVAQGVSAKSNPSILHNVSFDWTNAMFSWQRTAFHFQPQKNWMNGKSKHFFFHVSKLHLYFVVSCTEWLVRFWSMHH